MLNATGRLVRTAPVGAAGEARLALPGGLYMVRVGVQWPGRYIFMY